MFGAEGSSQPNKDLEVRDHFDRMTRAYLRSVLTDELIEEHRTGDASHPSEALARLLAWCLRRPLPQQYAVKAERDGSFRLIAFAGKRGERPRYLGHERYPTVQQAQHGAFLRHISDLTE